MWFNSSLRFTLCETGWDGAVIPMKACHTGIDAHVVTPPLNGCFSGIDGCVWGMKKQ